MEEIINQICADVDSDIADFIKANSSVLSGLVPLTDGNTYKKRWELLPDPARTILDWQNARYQNVISKK